MTLRFVFSVTLVMTILLTLSSIRVVNKMLRTGDGVTVTITSCDRWDLLKRTIESFETFNTYSAIEERIILLDCSGEDFLQKVRLHFPHYKVVFSQSTSRRGEGRMLANVEYLSSMVTSKYWFYLEDDWLFYDRGFLEYGIAALKVTPSPQVIFRDHNVVKPQVNTTAGWSKVVDDIFVAPLRAPAGPGGVFGAFSFNPFVMRTVDKGKYVGDFRAYHSEAHLSREMWRRHHLHVAILNRGFVKHLGDGTRSKVHKVYNVDMVHSSL
jgi:hypothetical protein